MKPLRLLLTVICALMISVAIGQDIHKQVKSYNKSGHVDSSYMLLNKFIDKYEVEEKWDSMSTLLLLKSEVYQRDKSPKDQLDFTSANRKFIQEKLGENHELYLESIFLQSRIQMYNGILSEAELGYDLVISKDKKVNSTKQMGHMAMVNKAFLLLYSNRVNDGIALAELALESYKEGIDTFFFIQAYQVMSNGLNYLHKIDKALEYDMKALQLNTKRFGENHPNVGLTLDQIGASYKELGKYDLALKYQNKSKAIQYKYYKESGNVNFLANVLGNTSLTYSNIGEYQLAFENIEQAIEILEKQFDELNLNLLWYYEAATEILLKSERHLDAQQYVDKAMRIVMLNEEADVYDKFFVKAYQAEIYYENGKFGLAIKMAKEVYAYLDKEENKTEKDILHITSILSDCYADLGEYSIAEEWVSKGEAYADSYYSDLHSETLNAQMRRMYINLHSGNHAENETIFQDMLKKRNNGNGTNNLGNCLPDQYLIPICEIYANDLYTRISKGELTSKDYFAFLKDFEAYYEVHLSAIRSNARIQDESKLLKGIYQPGIHLLQNSSPEEVIVLAEKIKSFLTRLTLQNQLIKQNNSDEILSNSITTLLEAHHDSTRVNTFIEVSQLIEKFKNQKDSLYKNDIDSYRKKYGLKEVDITSIRNNLNLNEMLIEYFRYDSLIYAIYISQEEAYVDQIKFSEADKYISDHLDNRSDNTRQKLSDLFLNKDFIAKYDRLLIIPDDKLFFVNFEELSTSSGGYMLEEKSLRYAYSASILDQQKTLTSLSRSQYNILSLTPGFTSKLKEAYVIENKDEIIDSSWLFYIQQPFMLNLATNLARTQQSKSLTDHSATETNYKSEATNFKILHLGTHGILNDESPLFSKLIFAKDSLEDGYLHTYEIYGQNLNADLAVLSACNSGTGKIIEGEGVLSLAHAFTHAGCPSTLMTLWKVDEKSTSIILESFYENLKKGEEKSRALRNAKLSFLATAPTELKDPYYWAGLVLIGNDSALFEVPSSRYWYLLCGFLILLFAWYMVKRRRIT